MTEEEYKLMSSFHFEGAKVVVLPPLGYKLVGERDMAYNTAVLEVRLPESRNNSPSTTLVEVEAWGGVAQALSALRTGDVVAARGVVAGKPWVDRQGRQRYLTVLRLREVVLERKSESSETAQMSLEDEFGF